ncbi:MAG TPA: MFS transporter [Syntrophomonas sp.]|nr:MFS transporter [Syntrophomonas sp.]
MLEEEYLPKRNGVHYGWMIVFGGFMTQLILMFCLQAVPLLLSQMVETFNITLTQAGLITSVVGLFYGGMSWFWGGLSDKIGPRRSISLAGLVASVAFICFGLFAKGLTSAVICNCFVGFGAAGVFSASLPKLIGKWFHPTLRGRAMALITPGGTIMGVLLSLSLPAASVVFGWQHSLVGVGFCGILVCLFLYLILRDDPAEKGLVPNGSPEGTLVVPFKIGSAAENGASILNDYKTVLKLPITYHIGIIYIFWTAVYMLGNSWLAASFVYAGLPVTLAGASVTVQKLSSFIGQQIWGNFSDKFERKYIISMSCLIWIIGCLFFVHSWGNLTMMYLGVGIFALGIGVVPVWLATMADYYPAAYKGSGAGCISTLSLFGRFFGPLIAGAIGQSYGLPYAWYFACGCQLICGLGILTLPNVKGKEDTTDLKSQIA